MNISRFLDSSGFYMWLSRKLPKRLLAVCAVQVLAQATTGKYSSTVVPEITAVDAVNRFCRIHAIPGSGADEYYDSNRKVGRGAFEGGE